MSYLCALVSDLLTWAFRVWQHQSGPNDVKGAVDVHGVRILEWDYVDLVVRRQMAAHPFNSHEICYLWHKQRGSVQKGTTDRLCFLCMFLTFAEKNMHIPGSSVQTDPSQLEWNQQRRSRARALWSRTCPELPACVCLPLCGLDNPKGSQTAI